MSKAEGKKISIKFNLPLIGDVSGNESAFTVTGQEYQWLDGPDYNGILINKTYAIESTERYPGAKIWGSNQLIELPIGVEAFDYSDDISNEGTKIAHSYFGYGYEPDYAFDKNIATNWYALGTIDRWIGIDFGVNEKVISKFSIVNNPSRFKGYVFEASNDNLSWTTIKLGTFENLTTLQEIILSNYVAYRYYRLRCTSVYTGSNVGVSELEFYSPVYGYVSNYSNLFEVIRIDGIKRVKWIENIPNETSMSIEYSNEEVPGTWNQLSNGDTIDCNNSLWLRATLTTSNPSVTPELIEIWVEEVEQPNDQMLLNMVDSFRNVVGSIGIHYNQLYGTLRGDGGLISTFTKSFEPDGLLNGLTSNGCDVGFHENFNANLVGIVNFIELDKTSSYSDNENIEGNLNGTISFIHVDDLNP